MYLSAEKSQLSYSSVYLTHFHFHKTAFAFLYIVNNKSIGTENLIGEKHLF
jgi:hypothetical protein